MINNITTDKYTQFDDVIINEYLETDKGDFNLERYYIGGIEEDGTEYLDGACGCIISLNEVSADNDHKVISDLLSILNTDYEVKVDDEVIYMTFPDIRRSLTIENYDCEGETENIIEIIKNYLK
jgi:hypothetical protein